ncbi:MAG: polysaccharide deacetylase family protein [Rhizobacter sp.]
MGGKKALLAKLMAGAGLMRGRMTDGPRNLVVLAYHRVLDVANEDDFASDPELVSASISEFRRQIKFVREHWNPISLSAAMAAIDSGKKLPPRSVAITFDDGHFDNHTHAFPVLREFGVPATIFLSTQYIGSNDMFWFERVSALLFRAPAGDLRVADTDTVLQLNGVASRRSESERLLAVLKRVPDARRKELLQWLETKLGEHAPRDPAISGALNWDQVREMSQHGIEFGSHTVTHPVLSMQSDEEIRFELDQSRKVIQNETNTPVDLLAYPVGKSYAFNDKVIAIAKECGYRAALAYIDGVNDAALANRFALRRIAVERYIPHSLFMARMTFPRVFV